MGFNNPDLITRLDIDPARAQRNALVNQGLQQTNELRGRQIAEAPEDRNYLLQQREQAAQDKPIMDARSGAAFLARAMPTIQDVGSYYGQRDALITKFGVPEDLLPDQAMIQGLATKNGIDEQTVFEKIKQAYMPQGQPEKPEKPRNFETWQNPDGTTVNLRQGEEPPSGATKYKAGGEIIESDGEGGFRITRGGATQGAAPMTRKTQGALETKFLNAANHLSRIGEIKSRYNAEYLEAMPRLKGVWTSLKSKFGAKIPEREKKKLQKQTAFLRTTISNLNKHIKEVTGAQMSEKEAGRIGLEEPKAGQSWFDFLWSGDSPIEFETKIEDIELTLRASMARTQWYLNKGMTYPEIAAVVKADAAKDLEQIKDRMQ